MSCAFHGDNRMQRYSPDPFFRRSMACEDLVEVGLRPTSKVPQAECRKVKGQALHKRTFSADRLTKESSSTRLVLYDSFVNI